MNRQSAIKEYVLLAAFYSAMEEDVRIRATHITVYLALLHRWSAGGCINPLVLERMQVMKTAKISARYTYHKSIRELHQYGYIRYIPSFLPAQKSVVYLLPL